jgi:hypothetical protein
MGDSNSAIFSIQTKALGPQGKLPLTDHMLRNEPSGNLFGMTQNVGMGWKPSKLNGKQVRLSHRALGSGSINEGSCT